MFMLKIDIHNPQRIRTPTSNAQVLALGQTYLAQEHSLPAAEQLQQPSLALIETAVTEVETAVQRAHSGETDRARASEILRQNLGKAKKLLKTARKSLDLRYQDNLAELEAWGFDTVLGKDKVSVRLPRRRDGWLSLLAAYLAHEAELPEANRNSIPSYDEVNAVAEVVQQSLADRQAGRGQRESAIRERGEKAGRLWQLLQLAAAVRIIIHHNGVVTPDLQPWGYEVVDPSEPAGQ